MGELIQEGKIKYWGVSNETSYGLAMMCETAQRMGVQMPTTIQNDFSMCDRCAAALPTAFCMTRVYQCFLDDGAPMHPMLSLILLGTTYRP